jgi:hypothetical protein
MKLFCPDCGADISADAVNLASGMGKCAACNSVFNLEDRMDRQRRSDADALSSSNVIFARPEKMQIQQTANTWTVAWRWLRWHYVGLLIFCIAWDSFLIFWFKMVLRGNAPWIAVVFPIGHVAVGIGLTYTVVCGFLNSTKIEASRSLLTIRHGPLPWLGNREVPAAQIEQLYCEKSRSNRNGYDNFALCAILRGGRKLKLLSGCSGADEAKFLEHELERQLHIPPRPVAGEYN